MSLTEEAVHAIVSYRETVLRKPAGIEDEKSRLKQTLASIGRRDKNIFYSVNRQSFIGFPASESFDREEYLTFRYLFESSYAVRRILVHDKITSLISRIPSVLQKNPQLEREYEQKYNQFSFESATKRAAIKAEAQMHGVKRSKDFYVIKRISESPSQFDIRNTSDWLLPRKYKSNLHQQFRTSAKEIASSWGLSGGLADFYIQHIERKKMTERAAIVSAVAGGAVLAAWGLSRIIQSQNLVAEAATASFTTSAGMTLTDASTSIDPMLIQPLYGLDNLPQYMAPQANSLIANQAAFLNHLGYQGRTNAYDVELAKIQGHNQMANTAMTSIGDALTKQYDYGLAANVQSCLGASINSPGNILGSNTNMTIRDVSPDLATITGTVNGQSIWTNIRRIGNTINITSM